MASLAKELHFVLFPLMAQGHMIPTVDIGRILAQRGATVTIITTPLNAARFKPVIVRAIGAELDIRVIELQFPSVEAGLPEGCESFDMLSSGMLSFNIFTAIELLREPAERVLQEMKPKPSCIISDSFFSWTTHMAKELQIPRIIFHGPGFFAILCMHLIVSSNLIDGLTSDSDRIVLPGLPHRVEVTKCQISAFGDGGSSPPVNPMRDIIEKLKEAEKEAYGYVVNTFHELEPEYAKEYAKVKSGKRIWCIGPVSLSNRSNMDMGDRGNKAGINAQDCLGWLDSRDPSSVIYVCLGSLSRQATAQAIELGLGLEASNRPFIWCVRQKSEELERWFLEQGFEERVKDRGLVIHGWAPQLLILSHGALGGFLTHCGWNSTLEGITAGLPLLTWPHFADQFFNETLVVEVLKIGVRIGVQVPVVYGEEENIGVLVKKDDIKVAVETVMSEGEGGRERRERAKELGEMAKRAMEEGGSSYLDTTRLIQNVIEQLSSNQNSNGLN